ncbi:MAG: hypothetical protein B0D96_01315 [Candidatus Sedimenticola endophacoides]|nr:MAG: hypothetical protein B0D94_04510 [Candidatus Sedimenticola endophacoides]OQX37755.1 MAG: hypothetical protein B0D96_01315 [Candidatus Sedimenticola endophacoides]OQX38990.1 MAG: hypothetical protein B0D89_11670 [Candidatus Sedimenticola endophacoides]OQX46373.1 MAG: hypothetical protein B0D90_01215 [Candidatus Sedimenticola endophacoides]OQX47295.1 MAG: hypothetical protein B0D85_01760 [Candidatus Sedimenticola endophacoides]
MILVQLALTLNVVRLNRRLRHQQEVVLQNQEQFRSLFQQAAVGFAYASPTGTIHRANQRLAELTNQTEVQLQRLNITDLIDSSDFSLANASFEAMRRGEIGQFSMQTRIGNDNRTVWTLFTLSAVRDQIGKMKYLIGVFNDITELKNLEHALDNEQRMKSVILNIAGDGILGLDKEGRHTFINPAAARLLGYQEQELMGRDSHACWHHTHKDGSPFPAEACPITAVLKDGIVHRGVDEIFWRKDGTSFAAEYISTPIREGDEVTGAVLIFRESDPNGLHQNNGLTPPPP